MSALLKELMVDFGYITEADDGLEVEKQVKAQLDRAAKMDEVDTVTFGLETDDGRMVKVYVKAEQANDFEKALGEKLGTVDSIEQALNELAKDFEIIAVEFPEPKEGEDEVEDEEDEGEEAEAPESPEQTPPEGEQAPDQQVYFNRNGAKGDTMSKESYKEQVLNRLLGEKREIEIATPAYGFKRGEVGGLDPYLNHPVQFMIYKALLELGVPDVALTKSAYRSQVVQGIKRHASAVMRDSALRLRLGYFLNQEIKQGEERGKDDKRESQDINAELMLAEAAEASAEFDALMGDIFQMLDSSPDNKYSKALKNSVQYRAMMRGATGTSSSAYTTLKSRMKMFRDQLSKVLTTRDPEARKAAAAAKIQPKSAVGGPTNEAAERPTIVKALEKKGPMRGHVASDQMKPGLKKVDVKVVKKPGVKEGVELTEDGWTFEPVGDKLVMTCDAMTITLDEENSERLIKGMSNRVAVVIKDADTGNKYAFSPRGSAVHVKATGTQTVCEMPSREVDKLLDTIAKFEMTAEELEELGLEPLNEVSPEGWSGTVKAMKKHTKITNPWALAWYMKKKGYKSRKPVEEQLELLDEKRRHKHKKPPVEEPAPEETDDDEVSGDENGGEEMEGGRRRRSKKNGDEDNAIVNGGGEKEAPADDDVSTDDDEAADDGEGKSKKKRRKYKRFLDMQDDAPKQVGGEGKDK